MNRPTFNEMFMNIATIVAKRSHHPKIKVGCVIASLDNQEILSIGYNGIESGGLNEVDSIKSGLSGCIHAEQNSVSRCRAPREQNKKVFITHSPCIVCARLLINLGGVKEIIILKKYKNDDGLKTLIKSGINVEFYKKSI